MLHRICFLLIVAQLASVVAEDADVSWFISPHLFHVPAETCDQVCRSQSRRCDQNALDDLSGKDAAYVHAKYSAAGHTCAVMKEACASGSNCVDSGSPYIHNSHFNKGLCWYGSTPSVAGCSLTPVDRGHRRLCPCISPIGKRVDKEHGGEKGKGKGKGKDQENGKEKGKGKGKGKGKDDGEYDVEHDGEYDKESDRGSEGDDQYEYEDDEEKGKGKGKGKDGEYEEEEGKNDHTGKGKGRQEKGKAKGKGKDEEDSEGKGKGKGKGKDNDEEYEEEEGKDDHTGKGKGRRQGKGKGRDEKGKGDAKGKGKDGADGEYDGEYDGEHDEDSDTRSEGEYEYEYENDDDGDDRDDSADGGDYYEVPGLLSVQHAQFPALRDFRVLHNPGALGAMVGALLAGTFACSACCFFRLGRRQQVSVRELATPLQEMQPRHSSGDFSNAA